MVNNTPACQFWPIFWWYNVGNTHLKTKLFLEQGRSYRGSGVRTSPTSPKRSAKIDFFSFFFLSFIAQKNVFVEKDERTPPTENKSCKTRHGQVRIALRPNAVATKENQP